MDGGARARRQAGKGAGHQAALEVAVRAGGLAPLQPGGQRIFDNDIARRASANIADGDAEANWRASKHFFGVRGLDDIKYGFRGA